MSLYLGTDLVAPATAGAANQSLSNLNATGEARFSAKQDVITWGTSTSNISETRPAVVKEAYRNGANWYRVWTDGWIEQGGEFTAPTTDTTLDVNLIKTMTSTNYTVILGGIAQAAQGTASKEYVSSKTTAKFVIQFRGQEAQTHNWYACGY